MVTKTRTWTADDLDQLPDDGNRYEVVDGELFVTPAPSFTHQYLAGAIYRRLYPFVEQREQIGWVMLAPGDVHVNATNRVQPDVFVVPRTPAGRPASWRDAGMPVLVVEILSDSTAQRDSGPKRALYNGAGIDEYWIVDHERRALHIIRRGVPSVESSDRITWHPSGASEPLVIDLQALFREALDG